jgi:NAD(P)-dependent dehydrogenase (short-subunit alcohol dehydrogenase family)
MLSRSRDIFGSLSHVCHYHASFYFLISSEWLFGLQQCYFNSYELTTFSTYSSFIHHPINMGGYWKQTFPSSPPLTEKNLPSLVGKVFIVTGGSAGIGLELVKFLYSKGGTVYIAGRSPTKIATAIEGIKSKYPASTGDVKSLALDLNDLSTVSTCVSTFLAQESRLDVLFNNAGIAHVPAGSITAQGHEAHIGTNCLGPFLLTKLLLPILIRTAKSSPKASVRIIFTSSSIVDMGGPEGGLSLAELAPGQYSKDKARNYSSSKAGNWMLASEFDRRVREHGIVCVTQNPGNLTTNSWDGVPWVVKLITKPIMHEPKFGAYTELWVGLSTEVTCDDGGRYGVPWGGWHPDPRKDVLESLKSKQDGGTGLAAEFWDWCETQTKEFAGAGN